MADFWYGFQGTVNEVQWAGLMAGVGQKYTLVSGDPVRSTGRTVYVDPRTQIGCGVVFGHDAVKSLVVPTPASGQWHLLVARRTWGGSPSVAYSLVAGTTTADAAQTTPPVSLPGARNKNVGVVDDEPIAWVHTRASTTTLTLFQMSTKRDGRIPGLWAMFDPNEQGIYEVYNEADSKQYVWSGSAWVNPLPDLSKLPVAMASGTVTAPGSGTGTITFPAGVFTKVPHISVTSTSYRFAVTTQSKTITGFSYLQVNSAGTGQAGTIDWIAVQMTP